MEQFKYIQATCAPTTAAAIATGPQTGDGEKYSLSILKSDDAKLLVRTVTRPSLEAMMAEMIQTAKRRSTSPTPRLIDKVIGYSFPVTVISNDNLRTYTLSGAADIAETLNHTPIRYVLDTEVTRFCAELACKNAEFLQQCLDLVRLPAHQFWVEFDEDERLATLERQTPGRFVQVSGQSSTSAPTGRRFGMMVSANEDGTGGVARVCWSQSAQDAHPDVSPAQIEFHLRDRAAPSLGDATNGVAPLANPLASISRLNAFASLRIEASWLSYYKAEAKTPEQYAATLSALSGQMWFDWALLAAFLVSLNVKGGLSQTPVPEMAAIAGRRRLIAPRRSAHIEVTTSLFGEAHGAPRAATDARSGKRLHYVRGHLVRRRGRIFWRSSHLRGDISIAPPGTRTVAMRLQG